ncbi:MAG TPA: hypothetical protein PKC43_04170 [Phycisphaerales bacterium]|nr:hypothetical protein [Phycisphaerales bacterium]HMP36623.1 hypothetical protein [Phycisphaerales bacterium]
MAPLTHRAHASSPARLRRTVGPRATRARVGAEGSSRGRRGNALVLVAAILVLLVISATALLSRARAGRAVAAAESQVSSQDDRVAVFAHEIAQQVADALFPAPVDPSDPAIGTPGFPDFGFASSNWPRLPRSLILEAYGDEGRYTVDPQDGVHASINGGQPNGLPDFSYNVAPWSVRPWTNWPALLGRYNPGIPGAVNDDIPGEPGFNDARWLRCTEPNRFDPNGVGFDTTFSHWQHLTYIPTANNGWRVVADIADITAPGNLITDLRVPIEQWPLELNFDPGSLRVSPDEAESVGFFLNNFSQRRDAWFFNYDGVYDNPAAALKNFYRLADLGDPSDEFLANTPRNIVSRTFADTDGDGFTDAFWMLAPASADGTLRHLVAVSVVDNSAMVNVNTATRFVRRNSDDRVIAGGVIPATATRGRTAADVALTGWFTAVANNAVAGNPPFGTGLLDNPLNHGGVGFPVDLFEPGLSVAFNPNQWGNSADGRSVMDGVGLRGNAALDPQQYAPALVSYLDDRLSPLESAPGAPFQPYLLPARDRELYFRSGAMRRLGPAFGLTPFGVPEEIELRSFHGQNIASALSRFERSVSQSPVPAIPSATPYLLRSIIGIREETSEYLDQLTNPQLVFDTRRKVTMFNGGWNDVMPTWLWPSALPPNITGENLVERTQNLAGQLTARWMRPVNSVTPAQDPLSLNPATAVTVHDFVRWSQLIRKIDLRAMVPDPRFFQDLGAPFQENYDLQANEHRELFRDHLLRVLYKVFFSEGDSVGYFGSSQDDRKRTRSLIASYAANVEAWMDGPRRIISPGPGAPIAVDRPLRYVDARQYQDPSNPGRRFIGQERQPFIMEAFVAHVYAKASVPATYPGPLFPNDDRRVRIPLGQPDEGEHFIDQSSKAYTVAVVQLGNPYNTPIVIAQRRVGDAGNGTSDFRVRLFNQGYTFGFSSLENPLDNNLRTLKVDTDGDGVADWEQLLLLPTTEDEPRSVIVYAMPETVEEPSGSATPDIDAAFGARFRDFLDIGLDTEPATVAGVAVPPAFLGRELFEDPRTPMWDTLRFRANGPWKTEYSGPNDSVPYGNAGDSSVELLRNVGGAWVVVDRLDFVDGACDGGVPAWDFRDKVNRLRGPASDPKYQPPPQAYAWSPNQPQINYYNGIRIGSRDYFVTWAQSARGWGRDVDGDGVISNVEKAPRYAVAKRPPADIVKTQQFDRFIGQSSEQVIGAAFRKDQDPDLDPWFLSDGGARRKPAYFITRTVSGPGGVVYPTQGFPVRAQDFTGLSPGQFVQGTNWIVQDGVEIASKTDGFTAPLDFQYQMLHPDLGFTQVGELALVPLWGTVIDGSGNTVWTLPEILAGCASEYPVEEGIYFNRLRLYDDIDPNDLRLAPIVGRDVAAEPTGTPQPQLLAAIRNNPAQHRPFLPAGAGLFDAFVCDGPGSRPLRGYVWNPGLGQFMLTIVDGGTNFDANVTALSPRAAGGEQGLPEILGVNATVRGPNGSAPWGELPFDPSIVRSPVAVPGLINVNTAPVEVLRAMPHMSWMVHSERRPQNALDLARTRVRIPEAIVQYRDRNLEPPTGAKPRYADRGTTNGFIPGLRGARGFESLGELLLLRRSSPSAPLSQPAAPGLDAGQQARVAAAHRIDFARLNPWEFPLRDWPDVAPDGAMKLGADARISVDALPMQTGPNIDPIGGLYDGSIAAGVLGRPGSDGVSGDAKEANLLFSGISNIATTRSDVFTVTMRVRTVRQDPVTGRWNGTDRESIVDEARYVMLVDRTSVRRPDQPPRVLYLEKLPP